MSGFFDRMLGRGRDNSSANQAKERLQFVLVHDRMNLPPEKLKLMKEEILAVISKYVAVTNEEVDIALQQRDRQNNLIVAEIPFTKSVDSDPEPNASIKDTDENDDLEDFDDESDTIAVETTDIETDTDTPSS